MGVNKPMGWVLVERFRGTRNGVKNPIVCVWTAGGWSFSGESAPIVSPTEMGALGDRLRLRNDKHWYWEAMTTEDYHMAQIAGETQRW